MVEHDFKEYFENALKQYSEYKKLEKTKDFSFSDNHCLEA